jgi:hypothetical protein
LSPLSFDAPKNGQMGFVMVVRGDRHKSGSQKSQPDFSGWDFCLFLELFNASPRKIERIDLLLRPKSS